MSIGRAVALYQRFFGRKPDVQEVVTVQCPKATTGIVIGRIKSIVYHPTQGSRVLEHEFTKGREPRLVVTDNGRQIFVLDGAYQFTARGFRG